MSRHRSPRRSLIGLSASLALACPLAAGPGPADAADWPAFRGPTRDGVAPAGETAPLEWSATKNVKWKAPLPRPGNSSPVVVGGRVFVATALDARGTERALLCFDRRDGKQLWAKSVTVPGQEPTHATNPYAAASPAADADRVVVWHATGGLLCYDHAGTELWRRDLSPVRHIWGYAASPVIHKGVVFVNLGPGPRQAVCAVDLKTGNVMWQTDEPGGAEDKSPKTGGWLGSWSTPRVVDIGGQDQLLVFMPFRVNAYDATTGKVLWTAEGAGPLAYGDVYVTPPGPDGRRVGLAMAGYGGAAIGFAFGPATAVAADGAAPPATPVWRDAAKHPQRIGTGVLLGDRVIVPNEPYLGCYDVRTGKETWRHAIPGERFWGGIVRVGDRLYVTSQKGTTYVFAADPAEFKLLAKNELGEASNSTPAVSDGQMFLRTAGHLWCVGEP
jgi:outer membrane protein assembly factor BamB